MDAANKAGGHDNITCLLVRAEDKELVDESAVAVSPEQFGSRRCLSK